MADPPMYSVSCVDCEVKAKSYLKARVSSVVNGADDKETAILRAAVYSLIDDGLETKIRTPGCDFTFSSCSVDLHTFANSLQKRCEPGESNAAQGFQNFNAKPSLVLDQLQLLGLLTLTEDLINDSSSIRLILKPLLVESDGLIQYGGEEEEEWEDCSNTSMSEDEKDNSGADDNGDVHDDNDDVSSPFSEDPFFPSIRFAVPYPSLKNAAQIKNSILGSAKPRLRNIAHKKVARAVAALIFELGFCTQSGNNIACDNMESYTNVEYIQRPVMLGSVFRRVATRMVHKSAPPGSHAAARDYSRFKDIIMSLHTREIILSSNLNFQAGQNEKCLINLPLLLPRMKRISNPFVANGNGNGVGSERQPRLSPATARERQLLESPRVKRLAVDTHRNSTYPAPQIPVSLVGFNPSLRNTSAGGLTPAVATATVAAPRPPAPPQQPPQPVPQPPAPPAPAPPAPPANATTWNGPPTIIETLRAASQAVNQIKLLENGISVIGIPSNPSNHLSSRIDLLSMSGSTGAVWMFDFKCTSQPESREIWKLLKANIFDTTVANPSEDEKVIFVHDCRWLGPALDRQGGIKLHSVFDVQVAHGVLQVVKGFGGGGRSALRRSLENIFLDYKIRSNPKLNMGLYSNYQIFQRRPLSRTIEDFLSHDTFHLYEVGNILKTHLGTEGTKSVLRMSKAYSETHFIENHKSYKVLTGAAAAGGSAATGSTFDHKKLPHGIPLLVSFDDSRNLYSAAYVIAPREMSNITINGTTAAATTGTASADENGNLVDSNDAGNNGSDDTTTNNDNDPAQNRDVATVLSLFPTEISEAVRALCNTGYHGPDEETLDGEGELVGELLATTTTSAAPKKVAKMKWPIEILVDIGRPVSVRFSDGTETLLDDSLQFSVADALKLLLDARKRLGLGTGATDGGGSGELPAGNTTATATDTALATTTADTSLEMYPYGNEVHISDIFTSDNRAGIPGTLHRISAIRGRRHEILGLTYRIGRHIEGIGELVHDVLARVSRGTGNISTLIANGYSFDATTDTASSAGRTTPSLLLLGPPGVGKSTLLRDVARILANTFSKRVVVVDTSNEIAGEGSIPHACIGKARRMMVPRRDQQHEVMKEAVQNHNPDVVIIDEIADHCEVAAAKTIAQRGVALVGTAHGTCLDSILKNPELNPLIGGIQPVILGDQAVRSSNSAKKTQMERKGAPCFTTLIELLGPSKWRIHKDVAKSVDSLLSGRKAETELRWIAADGRFMAQLEGGGTHPMDKGGLKAAQLAMRAVAGQAAGVNGGEQVAWIADLALLANRYF